MQESLKPLGRLQSNASNDVQEAVIISCNVLADIYMLWKQMYLILLEMEDIQRKLDQAPEEMHPQLYEKLVHVIERVYQALRIEEHSGKE